jgi:hypothetical protein
MFPFLRAGQQIVRKSVLEQFLQNFRLVIFKSALPSRFSGSLPTADGTTGQSLNSLLPLFSNFNISSKSQAVHTLFKVGTSRFSGSLPTADDT